LFVFIVVCKLEKGHHTFAQIFGVIIGFPPLTEMIVHGVPAPQKKGQLMRLYFSVWRAGGHDGTVALLPPLEPRVRCGFVAHLISSGCHVTAK
jgi:hypothetical protein